jgi:hypothetical protein
MSSRQSIACGAIAGLFALFAEPALGLEPPGVRWQISPGPDADGNPPASQEALTGPIGGAQTNGTSTLTAAGSASVDFGSAALHGESAYAPGGLVLYGTWCSPGAGACSAVTTEWIDTLVLRSPDAPDGTTGSFTVELAVDGALDAFLPTGWTSYLGTQVRSSWSTSVWVDGAVRDVLTVSCFGALDLACSPFGVRNYYPPGGGYESTPLAAAFGSFSLGPYDFTWGQPFTIDVLIGTSTAVNRTSNTTGNPNASADVTSASLTLLSLYDASAGGGNPLPVVNARASAASGSAWLGVTLPEATPGAGAAVAALMLAALARRRCGPTRRGPRGAQSPWKAASRSAACISAPP